MAFIAIQNTLRQFRKRSTRKRRPKREAPKSRKRSTRKRRPQKLENEDPKLETGLSFINWLESLLLIQQESSTITNRMQFKSTQVVGFCTLCQHFFEHFSEAKALSIIRAFQWHFPQKINFFEKIKQKLTFFGSPCPTSSCVFKENED